MMTNIIKIPLKENLHVNKVISVLGLSNEPFYVDVKPDSEAKFNDCFFNVDRKIKKEQGGIVYGWQFWENSFLVEAEFHAVWQSPNGELIDTTPKAISSINKILFIVDESRKFNGSQVDNVRLNITSNELVDDFIELKKGIYRLLNNGDRANILGEIKLPESDKVMYDGINAAANRINEMILSNSTISTNCFCNSGYEYDECHRPALKEIFKNIV